MAHTERIRVVFSDVDAMNHVNNAAYFSYFETARTFYYLELTGRNRIQDIDFIVAKATCEFLRGLTFGESIRAVVWVSRVGRTSFTLSYAILDAKDQWVARGETVQVSYDYGRGSKKEIPEVLRGRLLEEIRKGPGIPMPPAET